MIVLSRNQSVPKYRVIEDHLRKQIGAGKFPLGSMLPTEEELCMRFGVSRATVRTALSNIQSDGLIVRSPAVGSRVVASIRQRSFQAGWNSVEDLLQHTKAVRLNVLSVEDIVLDEVLAEDLGFKVGRSVIRVEGVRWNKGETEVPLCFVEIFFDALFNGVIDDIRSSDVPVADLIHERYNVRIETIRQQISAQTLPQRIAAVLNAREGEVSLFIQRWYFDENGRMFETTRSHYPAGRFNYVVQFGRS